MNQSQNSHMGYDDNSAFRAGDFGEVGNMIVCGQTGVGKTALLTQIAIDHDTSDNSRADLNGEGNKS